MNTPRDALLNIENWQKATFDQQAKENPAARRRRKGVAAPDTTALRPADATVSPLDLYVYLKARFGEPNDVMMFTRAPGLENIIQWGYALTSGGHLFRLHGTSGRVEFVGERLSPDDWRALIAAIKHDFNRFGDQMKEVRRSLTRWSLFINPFRRVQMTVTHFALRLRSFEIKEPGPSAMAMTRAEADAYDKAFAMWMGATQYENRRNDRANARAGRRRGIRQLRCLRARQAAFIMLDRDGKVLVTTGPVRSSDARLRRAQALAHHAGVAVPIVRYLMDHKLGGQERIARERLNASSAAQIIAEARRALHTADSVPALRSVESQAALAYWSAWQPLRVPFPGSDLPRVPAHWRSFGTRRSQLSGASRLAVNPPNAMLNYLYAMLEAESRLSAVALGLDPGLGLSHVDLEARDSFACDLMEPIRPHIDAYVLDWLTRETPLRREWFFEQRDGNCRLMASFVALLSDTAPTWARAVAPIAEHVAQMLWSTARKPVSESRLPARLTQRHRRTARYDAPSVVGDALSKAHDCPGCGTPLKRRTVRCAACEAKEATKRLVGIAANGRQRSHNPDAQVRRADARRRDLRALREWKEADQPVWLTEEFYATEIQARLAFVTVSRLASAVGVSRPYASDIRSGKRRPHPRHWLTLAELVGVTSTNAQ